MSYPPQVALEEIRDAVEKAMRWAGSAGSETLRQDDKTYYAVVRCLEIISEASRRLPQDLKDRHPHIPWQNVADAGNAYRHAYHSLDVEIVWTTVNTALPALLEVVAGELEP